MIIARKKERERGEHPFSLGMVMFLRGWEGLGDIKVSDLTDTSVLLEWDMQDHTTTALLIKLRMDNSFSLLRL